MVSTPADSSYRNRELVAFSSVPTLGGTQAFGIYVMLSLRVSTVGRSASVHEGSLFTPEQR